MNQQAVNNFQYADDTDLVAETVADVQEITDKSTPQHQQIWS